MIPLPDPRSPAERICTYLHLFSQHEISEWKATCNYVANGDHGAPKQFIEFWRSVEVVGMDRDNLCPLVSLKFLNLLSPDQLIDGQHLVSCLHNGAESPMCRRVLSVLRDALEIAIAVRLTEMAER